MINQDTIPSELAYCQDLVKSLKATQPVDSSNAAIYKISSPDAPITVAPYPDERILRYIFNHPGVEDPLVQPLLNWNLTVFFAYKIYITDDPIYVGIPEQTAWLVHVRNDYVGGGIIGTLYFDVLSLIPLSYGASIGYEVVA